MLALLGTALNGASAKARPPRDFFGVAPQTPLTPGDAVRMRAGGLQVVRVVLYWPGLQRGPRSGIDWRGVDEAVATAARAHLRVLPVLYGGPSWVVGRSTALPVGNARQRRRWAAFVRAAVERYGTHGRFWIEHSITSPDYVPRRPVKRWQIWNEENFFYFTRPASPRRYGRLPKVSRRQVHRGDSRAQIVLGGLFGDPDERPPRAMDAAAFLQRLYRCSPSLAGAPDARLLRGRWHAQAQELRRAYRYLLRCRGWLKLEQVDWFTWKDVRGSCDFCDSVGLFRRGPRFKPKPAWHSLVRVASGPIDASARLGIPRDEALRPSTRRAGSSSPARSS